jgi:hypothetical protein
MQRKMRPRETQATKVGSKSYLRLSDFCKRDHVYVCACEFVPLYVYVSARCVYVYGCGPVRRGIVIVVVIGGLVVCGCVCV